LVNQVQQVAYDYNLCR